MTRQQYERLLAVVLALLVLATPVGCAMLGWWARGYVDEVRAWAEQPIVTGTPQPPVSVGVRSGDTLWSIAREFYPGRHTGQVVDAIRRMNPHLDPGRLRVGDVVKLPRIEDL